MAHFKVPLLRDFFIYIVELFNSFIPESQLPLFISSFFMNIFYICIYKSAAYALLDVKKTNRQKHILRQHLSSMPSIKAKFMVGYIEMTTARKGIMKFIVAENFLSRVLTWIVWIFLLMSFLWNTAIFVGWYIFIFKLIVCDLIGFIFSLIFGGLSWCWKFEK